jgi:predicted DNA-binding transcriptional regulator AlpA
MHPQPGSSKEKNVNDEPDRLWGVREVAEFLGVPVTTLYQWRYQGYGPPGARVGRYLRYDPRDVRAWFGRSTTARPDPGLSNDRGQRPEADPSRDHLLARPLA